MNNKLWFRLIFIFAFLGLIGSCFFFYFTLVDQSKNKGTTAALSERAVEFIRTDSSQGTGVWSKVDVLTPKSDTTPHTNAQVSTPCFKAVLPIETVNHQLRDEPDRCVFQARSISPPGYIVLSHYETAKPSEDSGILLRQKNPSTYYQQQLPASPFDQALLFISEDTATAFIWKKTTMLTISFTDGTIDKNKIPELFSAIITSIQLQTPAATASGEMAPVVNP